ncbi:unnamed protein product [Paramecium pentaurelia]|uniref:Uncharacterized protein n=1 Tax=Paramecium pentaurelia TaxID=43138 RepID=A0A8S1ULZ7_9CILI|nr:unnamed protein product [Paramecium pentaurelia]
MMKIVKSMAFWNGKVLKDVGGYFLDGQKQGFWREIIHNYWSQAEVYVIGEYYKNNKVGVWKYIFHNNIIGLGQYNYQGQRIAKWIELSDRFSNRSQITYIGEYQNGQKIGLWEIWYKDYETKRNKQIGGGLYDKINSIKIGRWIENCNNFRDCSQVIYQGQYKNGKKVGRWDILYRNQQSEAFQQMQNYIIKIKTKFSGGGSYDDQVQGDQIKIGSWIEISEEFYKWSQVTYQGEYKDGKRIGKWEIWFKDCHKNQKKLIGGGFYDEKSSTKIGKWIEQNLRFYYNSQVTWTGQYKNGQKVGRWDIVHEEQQMQIYIQISKYSGGGLYKEDGDSEIKIGNWIELSHNYRDWSQVTYSGEYKEDKKVGRWDIWYKDWETKKNEQLGSGHYDEISSIKNGVWIELSDIFDRYSQVIYDGEYQNGKKVGIWMELEKKRWKLQEGFKKIKDINYDN